MSSFDPRITAYFGDAVIQAGFMPLPHLFLRHYRKLGLGQLQAMFLLQLMEIAWDLGDPPNTISKLAVRLGVDRRTVQGCSRDVHDLGLIEIYDQFDASGAQVENGYDLAPLFRRLATLAPALKPTGDQRVRRSRSTSIAQDDVDRGRSVDHPRPRSEDQGGGWSMDQRMPRNGDHPLPASTIIESVSKGSQLNKESKKLSKNSKSTEEARVPLEPSSGSCGIEGQTDVEQAPHRSLRWHITLLPEEVAASHHILDRLGVNTSVATAAAPTLHPAEVWALGIYARAAHLPPAWIARQIYDASRQAPRAAELASRYDEAGRRLAALDMARAEAILDRVDACCPSQMQDLTHALVPCTLEEQAAAQAAWRVMAEQRRGPQYLFIPSPQHKQAFLSSDEATTACAADDSELVRVWQAVLISLQTDTARWEWETWLEPCHLIELEIERVVITTPNVFVRQEVETKYLMSLTNALHRVLRREVEVHVVIAVPPWGDAAA
ncbi:MAG: hypothetical protein NVS2B7_17060 [Herpetosiphon sp.]